MVFSFHFNVQVRALEQEVESLQREKDLIKHQYKFTEKNRIKSGQVQPRYQMLIVKRLLNTVSLFMMDSFKACLTSSYNINTYLPPKKSVSRQWQRASSLDLENILLPSHELFLFNTSEKQLENFSVHVFTEYLQCMIMFYLPDIYAVIRIRDTTLV